MITKGVFVLLMELVKQRLMSFGYELKEGDEMLLSFSVQKAESLVKNECNVSEIPEGLFNIAVDMAVGEFLLAKKTFAPDDIAGLNLDMAVERIQQGDSDTVFAVGKGSQTAEQRLDALIQHMLTGGREQFSCYRRIRW